MACVCLMIDWRVFCGGFLTSDWQVWEASNGVDGFADIHMYMHCNAFQSRAGDMMLVCWDHRWWGSAIEVRHASVCGQRVHAAC